MSTNFSSMLDISDNSNKYINMIEKLSVKVKFFINLYRMDKKNKLTRNVIIIQGNDFRRKLKLNLDLA